MTGSPSSALTSILETARHQYVFSAYQFLGEGPRGSISLSGGTTAHWKQATPVTDSTYFDIGSVTKAVVTTSLLALAVESAAVSLSDTLATHLPEFGSTRLGALVIADLLSHSAGLEAWLPVGAETTAAGLVDWFVREEGRVVARKPGEKAVYSDLGFLLLGLILERLWGDLNGSFVARVVDPLKLSQIRFGPLTGAACASTEFHLDRRRLLTGEVFDDNCFGLGGVAAHAGLFATATGLAPWAAEWLKATQGDSHWLSAKTARLFTSRANRAPGSSWALGWDTRSLEGSSAGTGFSLSSFGHLGYPGCSVWIDPLSKHFAVLLTNRVHPSRLDERIRQVRPQVHDAWAAFCRS